jgi:hypothetical protein
MQFDWKQLSTLDRVIAGGAAVAFIALFLPWWGVSASVLGISSSVSVSGWSAGFSAWAGGLLLTAAGVLLVLRRSGVSVPSAMGPSVQVAAIAAVGLLLVIIRWATLPRYHFSSISYGVGARYGLYVALIAGIAVVVAAVMELRASGEQVPWAQREHPEQAEPPEAPAAPEE